MASRPLRSPEQVAAFAKQAELEQQARQLRAEREALLRERLPEDLREIYQRGRGAEFIFGLLKRGQFPADTHQDVHAAIMFMAEFIVDMDNQVTAHPRFAEFWPEAAARKAEREQQDAVAPPQLLGPDGKPVSLEAVGEVILA